MEMGAKMSIKLISKVFDVTALSPTQKFIMIALADNANDEGICYPFIETITQKTSYTKRTIISNIEQLENYGYLQKRIRARKKGGRYSNIYLLFPQENYKNLDEKYQEYFSQSEPPAPITASSQSEPPAPKFDSQSEPPAPKLTIVEPSLIIEPSLKSVSPPETIANYLLSKITKNNIEFRVKNISSWVNDIDKAMRIDGRSPQQLLNCINWIYDDKEGNWWIDKILSGKKLRLQFNTMSMQANKQKQKDNGFDALLEVYNASE